MVNTKAIKARISSVKNIKKISKAMQMIAAVKMRKAVQAAVNSRSYAQIAAQLVLNLKRNQIKHPLAQVRDVSSMLLIVVTSNKGLCGNYNNFVLREAQKIANENKDKKISVIAIGSKSAGFAKRNGFNLVGIYDEINENSPISEISPISEHMIRGFKAKKYDQVTLIYTNYISGLVQKVDTKVLLPFTSTSIKNINQDIVNNEANEVVESQEMERQEESFTAIDEYLYEPKRTQLLKQAIPMLIEIEIYQALLESSASEHSSRMMAMKNATDSASDMINALTLEFNKGRQAAITQEVAEINAGAESLNG